MKIINNLIQTNNYQTNFRTAKNTKEKFNEIINEIKIESKSNNGISDRNEINSGEEVKQSYDIKKSTYEELVRISTDLYKSNKISLKEHGMLTFNPKKSSQWSKITMDKPDKKYYLTKADSYGRRDWLLEFEKRIENQRNLGNKLGANHIEKTLNKVKKLLA